MAGRRHVKSALAGRQSRRPQRGAALLIFLILVVTAALTYLVNGLTPEMIEARRAQKTNAVLAQAKVALLLYAETFREQQNKIQVDAGNLPPNYVHGFLPLPDLGTNNNTNPFGCPGFSGEGCDANLSGSALNKTVVGRFPWALLGTGPLRDGHGECLWYMVSGSHQRIEKTPVMNWDTLGQIDIVTANDITPAKLKSLIASAHDRPTAIIFSPGPPFANQNRGATDGNVVTHCGGNYIPANYLEPSLAAALLDSTGSATSASAYFSGNVSTSNTDVTNLAVVTQGKVYQDGTSLKSACPSGSATCGLVANDTGLEISPATLFDAIRKNNNFRREIDQMTERMAECARDQIATAVAASSTVTNDKVNDACSLSLDAFGPPGYYANYRDQVFVTQCASCAVTVDTVLTPSCAGALLFGSQRDKKTDGATQQYRRDATEKADASNYLEGANLTSFNSTGDAYAGISKLLRVSTTPPVQSLGQDIVRCILPGASMVAAPSALPVGRELSRYDPATRTVTLGRVNVESDQGYAGAALFGCVWTPEAHATGNGFRSYFRFNITDSGDGFAFAAVDGDVNSTYVCGAGEQHLGYSGNNGYTVPILYPKLGLEIDTRRNYQSNLSFLPDGFNPARTASTSPVTFRTLANGRADPSYTGGHIGLAYWGGETPINTRYSTNACTANSDCTSSSSCIANFCTYNACNADTDCLSPSTCDTTAHACVLKQEEDDNVHGQLPDTSAISRPPPRNPVAPTTPPTNPPYPPYGVDKLDPSLSSVPLTPIYMRVEVQHAYAGRDDTSRLVKVVATTNLTLTGLADVVDGISLTAGDSVLVTAQTDTTKNGVYIAAAGAWARAAQADEAAELTPGTSWFISEGATHKGSLWRLQNTEVPILNVSPLDIQRFRAAVKTVATSNVASLSGLVTIGGYVLQKDDRVLLVGQTDTKNNGVWAAAAGSWSRAVPEDTALGMKDGAMWFVSGGTSAGTYWRLNGDVTPGTSTVSIAQPAANDLYAARLTTQVWKEGSNAEQITRMKITTTSMNEMDPVVRYGTCNTGACPASNPVDQSCGGTETDGNRYCYTGQKPKLYDSQKIYDIRGSACGANLSCPTGPPAQFCGISATPGTNYCYRPALRTTRLGFTTSQSTQSQVITISDFFTTWLP
jgi:hypothetical protein